MESSSCLTATTIECEREEESLKNVPEWVQLPATFPFIAKVSRFLTSTTSQFASTIDQFELTRNLHALVIGISESLKYPLCQYHIIHSLCIYRKIIYKNDTHCQTVTNWNTSHMYLVFLLSLMISLKQQLDQPLVNGAWLEYTEGSLRTLNRLERQFLHALSYQTLVFPREFNTCTMSFIQVQHEHESLQLKRKDSKLCTTNSIYITTKA